MHDYQSICRDIERAGFTVFGAFHPGLDDLAPEDTGTLFLVGNAGSVMWERFARERVPQNDTMDAWTRLVSNALANELGATAHFPFDAPALPFQRWARAANAGFASPLGLNIHPDFGLWNAYRAALCFTEHLDLPAVTKTQSPCDTCREKPCLSACPVKAFDGHSYDVAACASHISKPAGASCTDFGCTARLACPVGRAYIYTQEQMQFHMSAFLKARKHKDI